MGEGVPFQGKNANVHKTLTSANKIHNKGDIAVVDSNNDQQLFRKDNVNEPGALRLYLENGK